MAKSGDSQLNAHIPKGLHTALKMEAVKRGKKIRQIVIVALSKEVGWKPKKKGK